MGIKKNKTNSVNDIDALKSEIEIYKLELRRDRLKNEAWSNAILKAAMTKKISTEAQCLIYELYNDEVDSINKRLF